MNNGQTPQAWVTAFDTAMTEKCIQMGCPRSWFELPAEDRELITAITHAIHLNARYFGIDNAVEFVWATSRKLARMPLKPIKKEIKE